MNFVAFTDEQNSWLSYVLCPDTLHQTRQQDLTNFLRKVCEKVLSEPKVRQIGKVTDSSGKGGQLIVSQNQFLKEKHIFTNQLNDFSLELQQVMRYVADK